MMFRLDGWGTELGVSVCNHDMRNIVMGIGGTQLKNTFLTEGYIWSLGDGSPAISQLKCPLTVALQNT